MPLPLVPLLVAGTAAAMALGWYFSEDQRIKRMLRGARRVSIGEFPHGGYQRVVGQVELDGVSLQAPLTGRRCAAYEVKVEEHRSSGKSSRWVTIIHEVQAVRFAVTDGTGRAYVDPLGAKLLIVADNRTSSGTFDDATERERAFLSTHGEDAEGWFFNRSLRYLEGVIEPGETVAILGHGTVSYDDDAPPPATTTGYRQPATTTKVELAEGDLPLCISDDDSVFDA